MSSRIKKNNSRKKSFGSSIRKILFHYPDLKYDGTKMYCLVCNVPLFLWNTNQWNRHLADARHTKNRKIQIPHATFIFDLIYSLTSCNIPLSAVNQHFRQFWSKYNKKWKLPRRDLFKCFPLVRERIRNDIKREIGDNNLWLTVCETTDVKRNAVLNVLVRILTPNGSSAPYLLASKRLKQASAQEIQQALLQTLREFGISNSQVLMFVTHDTPTMIELGQSLKSVLPNLVHLTCFLHTLHVVSEMIRKDYEHIDKLVADTKDVFQKSTKRSKKLKKSCPEIPELPSFAFTRGSTWLEAVFYYSEHFEQIKSVILTFDPKESQDVKKSQEYFNNAQTQADLQKICEDYVEVVDAIQKLRTGYMPLVETIQMLDSVEAKLQKLAYDTEFNIIDCFRDAMSKNEDYTKLCNVYGKCWNNEPLSDQEQHLLYASFTTIDTETPLSVYKKILSLQRSLLKSEIVETYAMMKVYTMKS